MSGIPKLGTWATEALFPSGVSAGLPTKVAPTGDLFVPGTPATAPQMNYIVAQLFSNPAIVMSMGVAASLNDWSAMQLASGLSSGYPITGAAWDQVNGRWIVVCGTTSGGGNLQIFETFDGGRTWTVVQTISGNVSQGVASVGGASLITMPASSPFEVCLLKPDDTTTVTTLAPPGTTATPFALNRAFLSGTVWGILSANQTGGTFNDGEFSVSSNGTTWVNYPLSGNWNADTNHVGQFLVASNSTTILAALCGVTAGTDTARLQTIIPDSSSGAPDYADLSATATFLPGTIIQGVAYDTIDALWGVLVYDGTNSKLYTTPDLATWTLVKTWSGVKCAGLATVGSVWAVGVPYALTPDSGARIQISTSVAGVATNAAVFSWTQSGLLDAAPLPLAFASSGNGLFAATAVKGMVSRQFAQL